jgi:hypothetical protein
MSAPNANTCRASRRQIRGNTNVICYGLAVRKHDPFHDRNWSFNPELRTGRKEPKPRKERKPVSDWMPLTRYWELRDLGLSANTDADLVAELKRRGLC